MQNKILKVYYGTNVNVYKPYGDKLYYYNINYFYSFCILKSIPMDTLKKYDINKGLKNLFYLTLVKVYYH